MPDKQVQKQWFVNKLRDIGQSMRAMARFVPLDASSMYRTLEGRRRLQLEEAERIAQFLGEPVEEVLRRAGVKVRGTGKHEVPLVGIVDAHGNIEPKEGAAVESADPALVAVRVDAKMAAMDGSVLYYHPRKNYEPDMMIGKLSKLETQAGPMVGVLRRGLKEGRFNIFTGTDEFEDVVVTSASPIVWIRT